MADIKQATKWLMEGHTVQRVSRRGHYWVVPWIPMRISYDVRCEDGGEHTLDYSDLLGEDWEIKEKDAQEDGNDAPKEGRNGYGG